MTATRSLGCSMARAMASALRVKNTAYFDIAADPLPPAHPWDPGIARWLEASRPRRDRQASKVNRSRCQRTARGGRASPAKVGQLERGRRDRQGAQLGVAAATSPPDPGQRRAEIVVAGALAQQDPQSEVSCLRRRSTRPGALRATTPPATATIRPCGPGRPHAWVALDRGHGTRLAQDRTGWDREAPR